MNPAAIAHLRAHLSRHGLATHTDDPRTGEVTVHGAGQHVTLVLHAMWWWRLTSFQGIDTLTRLHPRGMEDRTAADLAHHLATLGST